MNFQWILLALFAASLISEIVKALTRPMHRNVLNLISIPVAFIITYILQVMGAFQISPDYANKLLGLDKYGLGDFADLAANAGSSLLSPVIFILFYGVLRFILRLVYVNLICKLIESKEIKNEKRLLRAAINEEKRIVKAAVRESEERTAEILQTISNTDIEYEMDEYHRLDEDAIEEMVERRVKREKKERKKRGFFKESSEKKTVSIIAGAVSGFLAFAIAMMPVFYTMSILSDITNAIDKNNPDDNQNAIYCTIDWLDEYIVEPYEKSFVYEIYKSMALVDLMNSTVRLGTRIQVGEETHYVDDIVRGVISNTVTVVTNLISARPNPQVFGKALDGILTQPFLLSTLTGFITDMMADVEITEPAEGDILGAITNTILEHYKNASTSVIEQDMDAITDMLVYLVDQGFLFAIASGEVGFDEVLTDKDNIKGLLGTMSGLSVYDIVMSGAFELAVNTMGPMLGSPMNNVVGYTSFVDKIITAVGGVTPSTSEELANLQNLFKNSAEFEPNSGRILFLENKISELEEKPEAERTDAENVCLAFYKEKLQELETSAQTESDASSIWNYIIEPIMIVDMIQELGKVLEAEGEKIKADGEALQAQADALTTRVKEISDEIETIKNDALAQGGLSAEDQQRINDLTAESESLKAQADGFAAEAETLAQRGQDLINLVDPLVESVQGQVSEFEGRVEGFTPFINYFMNWMNVQKPFMLAGEDSSLAPMTLVIDGVLYMCNTDIFTIETLVELLTGLGGEGEGDSPEPDDVTPVADEGEAGMEYVNIQEILDKIPFKSLLEQLTVTSDKDAVEGKASPITELINYLIVNATGSSVDSEWVKTQLTSFGAIEGISASSKALADNIVGFLNATEEERANVEYKGVTVQAMLDSLKFGDDWTDEYKKHDSENLVDIIFLIIDLVGNLGGEAEGAVATSDETNHEGEGDATTEGNDLTAIFDLIKTLGVAFDKMAETHCIGDLPYLMIKGLLTSDMLSMAMLPSMYGEYVEQIDAINANYDLPELERDEDLTYAKFMDDFVNTFKGLIDKIGGVGGFM